jgi:four helix bundle protein
MSENIVLEKSYKFALRIVKLYKYLAEEKKEYVMSKSLLSRGTAIGERVKSAQEAESRAVFASDMGAALRNASATELRAKSAARQRVHRRQTTRLDARRLPGTDQAVD